MQTFKYRYRYAVSLEIGILAAKILGRQVEGNAVFVPVPSTNKRTRERGFNQSEVIANNIGKILKKPTIPILEKESSAQPQSGKDRYQRINLQSSAFLVQDGADAISKDSSILLVDDVCTTGATLHASAEALSQKGFRDISAVALFRGVERKKDRRR